MTRSMALALLVAVFTPSTLCADDAPLKVGVILPLSGDVASVGEAIRNGMTLAYEKLPAGEQRGIELVYEDDSFQMKHTLSAYKRLMQAARPHMLLCAGSGPCKALAPLVDAERIPLMAIATDPAVVAGRSYAVNFWVTAEQEVQTALPEAVRRGYKRIARVSAVTDFTISLKQTVDAQNRGRLEIVLDEEFLPEIRDFRTFLSRVRARRDIDALLVAVLPGQLGVFAKQAREMGIDLPMFGFETFEDSKEVEVSEGALLGQWYVNTDDPDERFLNEYRRRFPGASLYGASNGHDALLLMAHAARARLDREGINRMLHTLKDFSGALGTYSATGDNRFTLPAAVKVVTADGFAKVGRP